MEPEAAYRFGELITDGGGYLKAFLDHLVNWDHVAEMYEAAMKYSCRRGDALKGSGGLAPLFAIGAANRRHQSQP